MNDEERDLTKQEALEVLANLLNEALEASNDQQIEAILMAMAALAVAPQQEMDRVCDMILAYLYGMGTVLDAQKKKEESMA